MARRVKTGRRADVDERARAAGWVTLYRCAQASPNGRYCINPEDESEFQIFIDADDPEPLLEALGDFAEHGTFELIYNIDRLKMRMEMNALRDEGKKYADAIAELSAKHNTSESTITRMIRCTVKT